MAVTSTPILLTPDEAGIARAAAILRAGGLVATPTETVYGLAASAENEAAVAAIYRAKGRPDFNPLIVHVANVKDACRHALFDERAHALARQFWPGPLTMVLPRRKESPLAPAVTAGLPSVALRCPSHPVMHALLRAAGLPLAAPSANRSGAVSATCAAHVARSLNGKVDAILDGGSCKAGIESTIVALRADGSWQIIRPGPISEEQIARVLGPSVQATISNAQIEAPGQLANHYSPGKPVRLNARHACPDEYHIGFAEVAGDENLSATGDLEMAAAQLYAALHRAAASPKPRVAVAPIPDHGIGIAVNDRLRRAATQ